MERIDNAAALTPTETRALQVVVVASATFGVYGWATKAPSTLAYLATVAVLAGALLALRRPRGPLPSPLAAGSAALAVAHLAGGLVRVGDSVLYNATFLSPALRYDHLVHASAVFVATLVLLCIAGEAAGATVGLCVLAALGLGGLNEMVEFVATLAHQGSHVGGYDNTGWDLVSNAVGALAAAVWLRGHRPSQG